MNKAQLIGHLGNDPDTRYLPDSRAVTTLSIATTKRWKDRNTGEKRDHTEWHRVVFFGPQAEIIGQHTTKGSQLYVEGELRTRSYEKDGTRHYTTEIIGQNFEFIGAKQQRQENQQTNGSPPEDFDDDIPF